ncbi:MAG: hypothetical protein QF886_22750, partial [Planctomycetota bacterium]|nr:hypothetical protein [Planctomycetota bacterium]
NLTDEGAENAPVTVSGVMMGEADYIAPEQAQDAKNVTFSADIYSLGISLFQMLTGNLPFTGNTPYVVVLSHIDQALPDPRTYGVPLSQPVCELVEKMCAKKEEDRYQTHEEVIAAIDEMKNAEAVMSADTVARVEPTAASRDETTGDTSFRAKKTIAETSRFRRSKESKTPLLLGLAAGAAIILVLLVSAMIGDEPPESTEPKPVASTTPQKRPQNDPIDIQPAVTSPKVTEPNVPVPAPPKDVPKPGVDYPPAKIGGYVLYTDEELRDFRLLFEERMIEAKAADAKLALAKEMVQSEPEFKAGMRFLILHMSMKLAVAAEDATTAVPILVKLYALKNPLQKEYLVLMVPEQSRLFRERKGKKSKKEIEEDKKLSAFGNEVIVNSKGLCGWHLEDVEFDDARAALQHGVRVASAFSSAALLSLKRHEQLVAAGKEQFKLGDQLKAENSGQAIWAYMASGGFK